MPWKRILVLPLLAAVLCWACGCGHSQPDKAVHGTKEAFMKAEEGKGK